MFGITYEVSGVRCQASGVRCQVSGVSGQMSLSYIKKNQLKKNIVMELDGEESTIRFFPLFLTFNFDPLSFYPTYDSIQQLIGPFGYDQISLADPGKARGCSTNTVEMK